MNERNYISLQIAKRVHEAGIKGESEASWVYRIRNNEGFYILMPTPSFSLSLSNILPAYTFTEIWEMLPDTAVLGKWKEGDLEYTSIYCEGSKDFDNPNPADAAAELLLWLTKEGSAPKPIEKTPPDYDSLCDDWQGGRPR